LRCALTTVVAGAIVATGCTGGSDTTAADGRPARVVDRHVIAVGSGPYDVLWAFGSAWVSDTEGRGHVLAVVSRRRARPELLELVGGRVQRRWAMPRRDVVGIAANRSGIWVRSSQRGSSEISALTRTGDLRPVAHVGAHALGFAAGPRARWTVDYRRGTATILTLGP
jgi:hypothetical protein